MKKQFITKFVLAGVFFIGMPIVGGILVSILQGIGLNSNILSIVTVASWILGLVLAIINIVQGVKLVKAYKQENGGGNGRAGRERGGKGGREERRGGGRREEPRRSSHDDDGDDDIVTLLDKDGNEVDMVEIAGINYRGKFYAILQPVELLEGMDDDEALVFKVTRDRNGEDQFEIELDDDIIDAVFEEYNRLLDEEMNK